MSSELTAVSSAQLYWLRPRRALQVTTCSTQYLTSTSFSTPTNKARRSFSHLLLTLSSKHRRARSRSPSRSPMSENNTQVTSGKPKTAELAIDSSSDASSHTGSDHSRPTTPDIQHNLYEPEVSTVVTTVNSRVDINLLAHQRIQICYLRDIAPYGQGKTNICQ
jgi:hypothetical protein